jgi:hypothetical protein
MQPERLASALACRRFFHIAELRGGSNNASTTDGHRSKKADVDNHKPVQTTEIPLLSWSMLDGRGAVRRPVTFGRYHVGELVVDTRLVLRALEEAALCEAGGVIESTVGAAVAANLRERLTRNADCFLDDQTNNGLFERLVGFAQAYAVPARNTEQFTEDEQRADLKRTIADLHDPNGQTHAKITKELNSLITMLAPKRKAGRPSKAMPPREVLRTWHATLCTELQPLARAFKWHGRDHGWTEYKGQCPEEAQLLDRVGLGSRWRSSRQTPSATVATLADAFLAYVCDSTPASIRGRRVRKPKPVK